MSLVIRGAAGLAGVAIAAGLLATGCSAISSAHPPAAQWLPLSAVDVVLDPLAPNWLIEQTNPAEDTYLLVLRMKRFHSGGDGEARLVLHRRARELARSNGYGGYEIQHFEEALDSAMLGTQRVAEATIRLTGKPAAPRTGVD